MADGIRADRKTASVSLTDLVSLARRNGFVWDAILGAEVARAYKPMPAVYLACAAAFDIAPEHTLMVAAHSSDLAAAAAVGLQTAFVARPDEMGHGLGEATPATPVDYCVSSILELAQIV
jgi:2-haloacid dehalogenase